MLQADLLTLASRVDFLWATLPPVAAHTSLVLLRRKHFSKR